MADPIRATMRPTVQEPVLEKCDPNHPAVNNSSLGPRPTAREQVEAEHSIPTQLRPLDRLHAHDDDGHRVQ